MSKYVERHQKVIYDDGFFQRVEEHIIMKLKKCPFCGGKAHAVSAQDEDFIEKQAVKCKECGAQTELYEELEAAVEAWNKRIGK